MIYNIEITSDDDELSGSVEVNIKLNAIFIQW